MDDKNAAGTLDEIRDGGAKMLATVRSRLAEIEKALDHGEFIKAHARSADLYGRLGHLAQAESNLAALVHVHVVRAEDVEEGMVIGPGPITSVEKERHICTGGGHVHVHVTVGWENGDTHTYDGEEELIVRHDDAE